MLTPFGKEVRKIRIDMNMKLMEMAEKLGVSPTFLTAVETGRKAVPADLPQRITERLRGDSTMLQILNHAAELSKKVHKIVIGRDSGDRDREVAAMFARAFPDLDETQKDKIKKILEDE